jgi:hypothetical protein
MIRYIQNLFRPKKTDQSIQDKKNETFVDVIFSLNNNYEIDISLLFDDNVKNKKISEIEYAVVCSEFLNIITSGKIKNQVIDIITNQIRTQDNKNLVDSILGLLTIMENSESAPLIKPTQVFSKYKNE